jgi:hypothetical protein
MQTWVWDNYRTQMGPVGPLEWALWPRSDAELGTIGPTQYGMPPRDPRQCSWSQNPEAFAVQIERVRQNLRAGLTNTTWVDAAPLAPWVPSSAPPNATATIAPYVATLESEVVKYLADAAGIDYSVPVIGWALAVVDLIIELCYAIFGTAQGTNTQPVTLQPGEQDTWQQYMAAVVSSLRALDDECRSLALPRRMTRIAVRPPTNAPRPSSSNVPPGWPPGSSSSPKPKPKKNPNVPPGWPPGGVGLLIDSETDTTIFDRDDWWQEPLGARAAEGHVGFAPVQLANYFTKANSEIELMESDQRQNPPRPTTEDAMTRWVAWRAEWQVYLNNPIAQAEWNPPVGWRAFKNAWDTTDTYLFYSDEWVLERIEKYERRLLEFRDNFVALGGLVSGPRPELGPPPSDWTPAKAGSMLDSLFWLGVLGIGVWGIVTLRKKAPA